MKSNFLVVLGALAVLFISGCTQTGQVVNSPQNSPIEPNSIPVPTTQLQVVKSGCTYRDTINLKDVIISLEIKVLRGNTKIGEYLWVLPENKYSGQGSPIPKTYVPGDTLWQEENWNVDWHHQEFTISNYPNDATLPFAYGVYYCSTQSTSNGCVKIYSNYASTAVCNLWSKKEYGI